MQGSEYQGISPPEKNQTGVLSETWSALGATSRWASCSIFSTRDHAAAAIAEFGTAAVFTSKGETLPKYLWCAVQMMTVPSADGDNQLGTIQAMPPFWFMKADSEVKDMCLAKFGCKELNSANTRCQV